MATQNQKNKAASALAPLPESVATYGALSLLAAHCPLHRSYSAAQLNRLFLPAIEHKSVRLFRTATNQPCAALIWARLSPAVASRMIEQNCPPKASEWKSGEHLWFLDLIAPFGHGLQIARDLARNPPKEAFSFARIGADGKIRKLVEIEGGGRVNRAFQASFFSPTGREEGG